MVTTPNTLQPMVQWLLLLTVVFRVCGSGNETAASRAVPSYNMVSHREKAELLTPYATHFSGPEDLSRNTSCQRKIQAGPKII